MIKSIDRKKIVECVRKEVKSKQRNYRNDVTLRRDRKSLTKIISHALAEESTARDFSKRLGFGTKEEYNQINFMYKFNSNYIFRYEADINYYQRLIIIDGKLLFFGVDDMFFQSSYKQLIEAFLSYFSSVSKKGRKK